jgi:hypothetical protein
MRFKYISIISLIFISFNLCAQQIEQEIDIKDIIESVAENLPEDYDMTELIEYLTRLRKRPININNTTPEELKQVLFLSSLQISNIFNHIKENGKFIDLLELQSVDGMDLNTIKNLMPFITIAQNNNYEKLTYKNIVKFSEQEILLRFGRIIEKQKGFTDLPGNRYLGGPEKFQLRYKYHFDDLISASITLDKDAGEKFISKPLDFYSANVALFKLGRIKKLVLGDYSLQFGQGLVLWSGFSFGKGSDVTSIAKKDLGLRPYSSTNEYSFLRGVATTINIYKNFDLTAFLSFRKLDASQDVNADGEMVQATINQTGLHRTPSEIDNKNSLSHIAYGAILQYQNTNLSVGAIAYQNNFSNKFTTQKATYDYFSFTGNSLTNIGLHYNYTYKNIYFFGEGGKSLNSGFAHINGALVSLSPITSLAIQYRSYAKNYHNFFNQAISEASEAVNENGLYSGLNIIPNKRWAFSVYADVFKFPWLKFRIDAPSKGYEILAQTIYSPTKTFKVTARFKTEVKQQNTDLDVPLNYLDDVKKENYRLNVDWSLNKQLSFQNRAEVSQYKKGDAEKEFGYIIYQDIAYKPQRLKLSGNLRLAYFNTPSYNNRIYAYEDDVLYSFAFGMYSGKGFRTYANLKYSALKHLNIWLRYAVFIYKDVETVGSYLDEIAGNKKSDLKIQLRYQF